MSSRRSSSSRASPRSAASSTSRRRAPSASTAGRRRRALRRDRRAGRRAREGAACCSSSPARRAARRRRPRCGRRSRARCGGRRRSAAGVLRSCLQLGLAPVAVSERGGQPLHRSRSAASRPRRHGPWRRARPPRRAPRRARCAGRRAGRRARPSARGRPRAPAVSPRLAFLVAACRSAWRLSERRLRSISEMMSSRRSRFADASSRLDLRDLLACLVARDPGRLLDQAAALLGLAGEDESDLALLDHE